MRSQPLPGASTCEVQKCGFCLSEVRRPGRATELAGRRRRPPRRGIATSIRLSPSDSVAKDILTAHANGDKTASHHRTIATRTQANAWTNGIMYARLGKTSRDVSS